VSTAKRRILAATFNAHVAAASPLESRSVITFELKKPRFCLTELMEINRIPAKMCNIRSEEDHG
jgi:hypothetical protein